MTLWQTSLTYQIWVWLCDVYSTSTLRRFHKQKEIQNGI